MRRHRKFERQRNFFNVCGKCHIHCCRDARPPITESRMKIIEEYLKKQDVRIERPFIRAEYVFPGEDQEGYCIFYDKATKRCRIHPVKPETCVAGPITFDINRNSGKIEWYLKFEEICPLAGAMHRDKEALREHLKTAKIEIMRLVRELPPEALRAILKREEPETFKIAEDDVDRDILSKL